MREAYYPRPIANVIPANMPAAEVRRLLRRYLDFSDPAIRALPAEYRAAVFGRLRELLAPQCREGAA